MNCSQPFSSRRLIAIVPARAQPGSSSGGGGSSGHQLSVGGFQTVSPGVPIQLQDPQTLGQLGDLFVPTTGGWIEVAQETKNINVGLVVTLASSYFNAENKVEFSVRGPNSFNSGVLGTLIFFQRQFVLASVPLGPGPFHAGKYSLFFSVSGDEIAVANINATLVFTSESG